MNGVPNLNGTRENGGACAGAWRHWISLFGGSLYAAADDVDAGGGEGHEQQNDANSS